MYTGTLIEELIATVERTEQYGRLRSTEELENWYAGAHSEAGPNKIYLGWRKWQQQAQQFRVQFLPAAEYRAGPGHRKFTFPRQSTTRAWSRSKTRCAAAK